MQTNDKTDLLESLARSILSCQNEEDRLDQIMKFHCKADQYIDHSDIDLGSCILRNTANDQKKYSRKRRLLEEAKRRALWHAQKSPSAGNSLARKKNLLEIEDDINLLEKEFNLHDDFLNTSLNESYKILKAVQEQVANNDSNPLICYALNYGLLKYAVPYTTSQGFYAHYAHNKKLIPGKHHPLHKRIIKYSNTRLAHLDITVLQPFYFEESYSINKIDDSENCIDDSGRLNWFGKLLRSSSLDELPELWNVLKGDMSLVGPRPLLKEYLPLYNEEQRRRHDVKPGITGWAQINGRNEISWEEKFKRDIWYVDNHNFGLDIKILLLTIKKILFREGINTKDSEIMPIFKGSKNEKK